jgi:hypothetical protein
MLSHLESTFTKNSGGGRSSFQAGVPLETAPRIGASLSVQVQERPGGPGTQVLSMRRFLIFVACLAVLPAIASAQSRGMGHTITSGMARPTMSRPAMARPAMAAPHFGVRAFQPVGSRNVSGGGVNPGIRVVRTRSGRLVLRPAPRQTSSMPGLRSGAAVLSEDVPGLGFDYPHYAATHPQEDPGHRHGRNAGFIGAYFPFYGGGYYLPVYPDEENIEEAPPAQPEQVETEEPAPTQTAIAERPAESPQENLPAQHAAPPQDSDQYVFVRRDGTLFFVVAYAWDNGTLRYITREGIRRNVSIATLDLNATRQFNEQRGLNFRLPT